MSNLHEHNHTASTGGLITSQEIIQCIQYLTKKGPISARLATEYVKSLPSVYFDYAAGYYKAVRDEAWPHIFQKYYKKELDLLGVPDCDTLVNQGFLYVEKHSEKLESFKRDRYGRLTEGKDYTGNDDY